MPQVEGAVLDQLQNTQGPQVRGTALHDGSAKKCPFSSPCSKLEDPRRVTQRTQDSKLQGLLLSAQLEMLQHSK